MTFLHASLLLGGLTALIPVMLHMLGRRQPKPIVFPAIRFVRQTAINAQRGWSIKRWLLLALRVLIVALLALALASPRVQSQMFATYLMIGMIGLLAVLASAAALTSFGSKRSLPTTAITSFIALALWIVGGAWFGIALSTGQSVAIPTASGPICAAVVIDTSPTMGYRYHNVTRLEIAKEMAIWLMDRLPVGSQIAIVNDDSGVRLNQDRISANRLLERTIVEGRAANLVQRISAAIDALRKSDLERREVYVLTDLSVPAWRDAGSSEIPAKLARKEDGKGVVGENVLLQLIDVSVPVAEIRNWSLNNFKLSQQSATPGSEVTFNAELQSTKGSGAKQIEVKLLSEPVDRSSQVSDGKIVVPSSRPAADPQLIQVNDGDIVPFKFTLKDLAEGTNHAEVRISLPDPLDIDNIVYLTIEARAQGQTLVVAENKSLGLLVCYAIDPIEQLETGNTDTIPREPMYKLASNEALAASDLSRFSSIVLYDPANISADSVDRIHSWVEQGGGLLLMLGPAFDSADSMMASPIFKLLPGNVKRIWRRPSEDPMSLAPVANNHPLFSIFERPVEEIPWGNYPVFRHWGIEDLSGASAVLMRFTKSEQPALVEQIVKQGRILTFALPYPEPPKTDSDQMWSLLYGEWPGFALFHGAVRYLAAWNKQQLNYFVDEPAVLENNVAQFPQVYRAYNPIQEDTRVESNQEVLIYPFTRFPGQYRLRGLKPQGPVIRGFSVNVNRQDVSLERIVPATLDSALGKDLYRIAKEKGDVQSSLGEGRYGRDLSPFLLVVLVMMIMAEQTMSSRFYTQAKKVFGT